MRDFIGVFGGNAPISAKSKQRQRQGKKRPAKTGRKSMQGYYRALTSRVQTTAGIT